MWTIIILAIFPASFIGAHLAVIVPEMWMMRYDPEHSIKTHCAELNRRCDELESLVKEVLLENGTKSEAIERAEWRVMNARASIYLAPTQVAGGNKDGWPKADELLNRARLELALIPQTLAGNNSLTVVQPLPKPKRKGITWF
jgi:hypothetical protein